MEEGPDTDFVPDVEARTGDIVATELYDHARDPDETINIADESRSVIDELQAHMDQLVDHRELTSP